MISICTTLYKSEKTILPFLERMTNVLSATNLAYEIIVVDDGSPDNSAALVQGFLRENAHIKLIELSRNFGHHKALRTAMKYSKGDLVFLIDSDLEEEPDLLNDFLKAKELNPSFDVVYGVQAQRKGDKIEKIGGGIFWKLYALLSDTTLMPNTSTVRLMTRRYVDAFLLSDENDFFIDGIADFTGFAKMPITFKKGSKGETSYTFSKRFHLAVNAITSFSAVPLKLIFYVGALLFALAGLIAIVTVSRYLFVGIPVQGWTSLILSIWLLGGLQLMMMGILGIYLARVFNEVKKRPFVIVKNIHES